MSTHNIGFYEDLTKVIFELSSNTHLISSTVPSMTQASKSDHSLPYALTGWLSFLHVGTCSKDSDYTGRMPRLIEVFAGCALQCMQYCCLCHSVVKMSTCAVYSEKCHLASGKRSKIH